MHPSQLLTSACASKSSSLTFDDIELRGVNYTRQRQPENTCKTPCSLFLATSIRQICVETAKPLQDSSSTVAESLLSEAILPWKV